MGVNEGKGTLSKAGKAHKRKELWQQVKRHRVLYLSLIHIYSQNQKGKRMKLMPLTLVNAGEPNVIRKVGGKEETRRFLENLGFVAGGVVTLSLIHISCMRPRMQFSRLHRALQAMRKAADAFHKSYRRFHGRKQSD